MSNWYYVIGEDQHGPVGEEDIQRMIASGELQADDLVWQTGMADWIDVGQAFPAHEAPPPGSEESIQPEEAYTPTNQEAEAAPVLENVFEDGGEPREPGAELHRPAMDRETAQTAEASPIAPLTRQIHPLAIAGLALAVSGFLTCGITAIPAIVLGHMALSRIKGEPERYGGEALAVAGLVVGYFLALIMLSMLVIILFAA
ncbi:MAG: GYF domain-containing protein [Candidatus Hydrogenedentota bacterium]